MSANLKPATAARPCPVCGGGHKCSRSADGGLVLCGRKTGPQPGFVPLGPADDPTWFKYLVEQPGRDETRTPPPTPPDWVALRDQLTDARRDELARTLGLPADALGDFPRLGWHRGRGGWAVPEDDGRGNVIGVGVRLPDGSKGFLAGGHRGVVVPARLYDRAGPLFCVEGFSDCYALTACGLAAVGRPGNKSGVEALAAVVAAWPADRAVVVVGENDAKPDGTWPGRDGAEFTAAELKKRHPGRTILVGMPPEPYKDARDWVTDRLTDRDGDPAAVGAEIAAGFARAAGEVKAGIAPPPPKGRFPLPLPVSQLTAAAGGAQWVWDGYLVRGGVTLLSALPKCGKTTLLTHLLKSFAVGGSFVGRPVACATALVVSEEGADVWANRRDELGLTDSVRVLPRPFFGKPSYDDWLAFVRHLIDQCAAVPTDLVVLDTLADLWPVKDENTATEVHAALQPLRALADGRAVLCVHHLRKSDGAEGTGSRGSGALAGFVDVIVELRRAKHDPTGRRRMLTAWGRHAGIPAEWAVELGAGGYTHRAGADEPSAEERAVEAGRVRATVESEKADDLRRAIAAVMADGAERTRKDIWDALPDAVRVNEVRFKSVIETLVGTALAKEGNGGRQAPFRYRLARGWVAAGG